MWTVFLAGRTAARHRALGSLRILAPNTGSLTNPPAGPPTVFAQGQAGDMLEEWQGSALIGSLSAQSLVRVTTDGNEATEAERIPMEGARIRVRWSRGRTASSTSSPTRTTVACGACARWKGSSYTPG